MKLKIGDWLVLDYVSREVLHLTKQLIDENGYKQFVVEYQNEERHCMWLDERFLIDNTYFASDLELALVGVNPYEI